MFGKVQEDSFQNVFDMSLEDNSFDSNSLGLGWGLGSSSTRNGSMFNSDTSSIWSNSLSDEEEDLCYRKTDPLRLQSPSELFFSSTQLRQMQRLSLNDSAYVSPGISSPTSSTASSCSFSSSNFDSPVQQHKQQRKQNPFGAKNILVHSNSSEDFGHSAFDTFSDTASLTSSASSTCSSSPRSSGLSSSSGQSNRYKTELCRPFQENGSCKYGEKCQFAHGASELRTVARHPKYKTDLCRTYHSSGFCPYGPRCHFIHNLDERANNDNGSSKAAIAAKRASGSKDRESVSSAGQVPQLPMFSSSQRSSPIFEFEEVSSPYVAHSSVGGGRPAPFGSAAGDMLQSSGRSAALANGGDAAVNNQSYARLPVFSTLVN